MAFGRDAGLLRQVERTNRLPILPRVRDPNALNVAHPAPLHEALGGFRRETIRTCRIFGELCNDNWLRSDEFVLLTNVITTTAFRERADAFGSGIDVK